MIKRIGSEARADLERFFEARVHLDLRVKVRSDWRDDDRKLDDLSVERGRRRR
jgi:GTP-binding protein Era